MKRKELCKVAEIPTDGSVKKVNFFGREVLVMQVDGQPKAIVNICMHHGGPMERQGNKLVCQWHDCEYEIGTGNLACGPAKPKSKLITLPTRVEGDGFFYWYEG